MSEIAGHGHIASIARNFQNTNTPDIDLDRDVLVAGGSFIENESRKTKKYKFNLSTIVMSAVVFIGILAWFDFIQTAFYSWLSPETQTSTPSPTIKLYYAILSTVFIAAVCGLLVIYSNPLAI